MNDHTDKSYYLVRDGPIAQKPYALVRVALAEYENVYVERPTELTPARIEGRGLVTPEATEEPRVLSIRDALQQRVARVMVPPSKSKKKALARKAAASAKTRTKTTTKQKQAKKKSG